MTPMQELCAMRDERDAAIRERDAAEAKRDEALRMYEAGPIPELGEE